MTNLVTARPPIGFVPNLAVLMPQTPAVHDSPRVHGSPSSHAVPSRTVLLTQPRVGSQVASWQGSVAGAQTRGSLLHCPASQRSLVVQASASAQSASISQQPVRPSWRQRLSFSTHPSVVQGFPSSQTAVVGAAHLPAVQVSSPLQKVPSLQLVPSATLVWTQPTPGTHASVVHGLWSSQSGGGAAAQVPFWQVLMP